MRLSTQAFHDNAVSAMLQQQLALSRIQTQIASGKRVNTPADDPIASVHILELERAQLESAQHAKNSAMARSRLSLEEQSLADVGTALQRIRELTVQAANIGTLSDNDRRSIVVELESRLAQLQDIGNRRDSAGEYLFGGFATMTPPFAGSESGNVTYAGDQGARMLQVGPTQRVADSHSGFDVFMNIPAGNGTFVTDFSVTNTGSGQIDVGAVVNRLDWQPDNYTLTFTSPTEWQITDSNAQVVADGTYTPGEPIEFRGIRVTITGEPGTDDTFTINQSRSESMFDTVSRLVNELSQPMDSDAAQARLASAIARTLQQLDQAGDHVLGIRAEVGARLNALDAADNVRENLDIDLASSLSDLRDLDYAQAIAKMNQYMMGLQAAQLSYSKVSQLSLFDYLR